MLQLLIYYNLINQRKQNLGTNCIHSSKYFFSATWLIFNVGPPYFRSEWRDIPQKSPSEGNSFGIRRGGQHRGLLVSVEIGIIEISLMAFLCKQSRTVPGGSIPHLTRDYSLSIWTSVTVDYNKQNCFDGSIWTYE